MRARFLCVPDIKQKGLLKQKAFLLWVSNRGERQPCWHTTLLAKSCVLYLCRTAAACRVRCVIPGRRTSMHVPDKRCREVRRRSRRTSRHFCCQAKVYKSSRSRRSNASGKWIKFRVVIPSDSTAAPSARPSCLWLSRGRVTGENAAPFPPPSALHHR